MAKLQPPVYGAINKPVFARLTPTMTSEQIKRNLISALKKSGFTIKPSVAPTDKGGSA